MEKTRVFEKFARGTERRRPCDAVLLRRCAADPLAMGLVPDHPDWDVPHRLLAAVQWLGIADSSPGGIARPLGRV